MLKVGSFGQGREVLPRIPLCRAVDKGHVPLPPDADEMRVPRAGVSRRDGWQVQLLQVFEHLYTMQIASPSVVDVHAVVRAVAPRAYADKEVAGGLVVDDVPGMIPKHLAIPLRINLSNLFEGVRRSVVG